MSQQVPIPFVFMRGGTSKAVFVRESDLPADRSLRDRVILSLFGSPDPRQVDGLGGADILTSKLAVIGPPSRGDADLDYTFGQVSISEPAVDYDINCGNISAAVGVYALEERIVRPGSSPVAVRIHNTNTDSVFVAHVPIEDGRPVVEGGLAIDGVPGTGASILLDYAETVGGATGRLLPTGNRDDMLDVPGHGAFRASIVDIGNLSVFFPAAALGLHGTEGPADLDLDRLSAFDAVKDAAARLLGLPEGGLVPVPVAVSPPADYMSYGTGEPVAAADVSLVARVVGGRPPAAHKAFPGTVGVTTAVAALIPGTAVFEAAVPPGRDEPVAIGHPSGVLPVWASVRAQGEGCLVEQAAYARTARRLAEGVAYVRRSVWPEEGIAVVTETYAP
jgi:2-methylaconitate cis-trans-isomerase PrpF